MLRPRSRTAEKGRAWTRDLDSDAIDRKNMDMVRVRTNEVKTKKKKAPGSLLKLVMKYRTILDVIALRTL
jgi:hypothetical protein